LVHAKEVCGSKATVLLAGNAASTRESVSINERGLRPAIGPGCLFLFGLCASPADHPDDRRHDEEKKMSGIGNFKIKIASRISLSFRLYSMFSS
jgi:hypothetical protein